MKRWDVVLYAHMYTKGVMDNQIKLRILVWFSWNMDLLFDLVSRALAQLPTLSKSWKIGKAIFQRLLTQWIGF
jgi:hypothetical protein